jgi:hypothetical protein
MRQVSEWRNLTDPGGGYTLLGGLEIRRRSVVVAYLHGSASLRGLI